MGEAGQKMRRHQYRQQWRQRQQEQDAAGHEEYADQQQPLQWCGTQQAHAGHQPEPAVTRFDGADIHAESSAPSPAVSAIRCSSTR